MAVMLQQRRDSAIDMMTFGTRTSPVATSMRLGSTSPTSIYPSRRRSSFNSKPRNVLANGQVKFLPINFHKPIFLPSHLAEYYHKQVELASLTFSFHAVVGQILCKNLSNNVDVDVFVRFTVDNWETHEDIDATFTTHHFGHARHDYYSCFSFKLDLTEGQLQQLKARSFVQFAVCCLVGDLEFWDNNAGENFSVAVSL
eukprot:comp5623_c0_seq1/m.1532 comp5623_c0_seq1/g.1532  ORF comp5623_c0_seq1/g.1532 comp5623_c0_seq1/m.1532 type:complete len:199 (-) comp5623_c0_seq1:153-749(-)